MKKLLIFLLAGLMLLGSASALEGTNYPAYDGAALPSNALAGSFDADRLLLSFDASAEFSMCENGYLQACFYAMSAVSDSYIEIYLLFPQSTASGDVLTPDSMLAAGMKESSISFYEVRQTQEDFYVSMQNEAGKYPQNSDYEIRISSFTETDIAYAVHGTLSAALAEVREMQPTGKVLTLRDVEFDFTLPKSAAPRGGMPETTQEPSESVNPDQTQAPSEFVNPEQTQAPFDFALPEQTHEPADAAVFPAFTLPPNYAKI